MDSEKLVQRIMSEIDDAHAREDRRKWVETAARAAVRIVVEECANVLDNESEAMLEQRDDIIESGTLYGRECPEWFRQSYAHERKVLSEGYEGIASFLRRSLSPDAKEQG